MLKLHVVVETVAAKRITETAFVRLNPLLFDVNLDVKPLIFCVNIESHCYHMWHGTYLPDIVC